MGNNGNIIEISPETRRRKIIYFIINHEGCTRADLVRGLVNDMSKKTVYKLVGILVKQKILRQYKDKKSKKKTPLKLFVNKSNLLACVTIELEQFHSAFISFFDKTNEKIIFPSIFSPSPDIAANVISQLSEQKSIIVL